ncbi:hypothetical protein [Algoriphagus boritolerans]|uniref:Uncharacterized protein n=1 Tax=Algoriphagus boritolerans DSM 17298 = JCM 18970 TaxID=1120964 RepID=A0A1H5ZSA6_9BACT|nr:hypothetical protein [Algoriphagus boritolerans]SEG39358.1 hypothetical protein SAMN03080598_03711 [Algoriphagus boritolerans DSM 17298 = JCM 18970]
MVNESPNPYPEIADLEEVSIPVKRNGKKHTMRINIFLPKKAVFETEFESLEGPVHLESVGHHIREGKYDLTWEDWELFLEFWERNI